MNAGVILFLIFAVCVLIGVPISMSLGIGSLAAVALGNLGVSPAVIAQRVFGGLQSTSIMAIAFFILAGNLMAGGGISRRIVNFANCLIGNIRGGMSVALVIACAFFAALSGSAPATVVAIGSMLYADMVKQGYPEDRTAGLLVIAGGLGPVIPPSIIMVLYLHPDRCVRHQHVQPGHGHRHSDHDRPDPGSSVLCSQGKVAQG